MSEKAADFVTKLSEDPALMERFKQDPMAAMEGYDLSDEDKKVLASGDVERIRAYLGDHDRPECMVVVF